MIKIDGIAQMKVVLTIEELSYLKAYGLFDVLVPLFCIILVTLRFMPAPFALIRS